VAERVSPGRTCLKENDRIAGELRLALAGRGTLCLKPDLLAGAGKTSILEGTPRGIAATPLRAPSSPAISRPSATRTG